MEKERKNLVKVKRKHGVNEKRCFGVFCVCVLFLFFTYGRSQSHADNKEPTEKEKLFEDKDRR